MELYRTDRWRGHSSVSLSPKRKTRTRNPELISFGSRVRVLLFWGYQDAGSNTRTHVPWGEASSSSSVPPMMATSP